MYLSGESLIVILFVGLVAGWLAGKIVRGTGFGIIGDIVVGILGAFIASWLFPRLGIHLGVGIVSEIIFSAIGAILLLLIVRLIRTGGRF
jgi:uncharacterized membrane protein YeaQ/YmgE (transglycosylase-associated protein family)